AVLACPPHDHHEGGLLALALHLRLGGWRVSVLGADTPVEAMASACRVARADVLALSFVHRREAAGLEALLRDIVAACGCPVVVGGPAAREHLKVVFTAGAHYAESARELRAIVGPARVAGR
ncbi:MAG TPA: cobalamin-dependent protein, partial [Myxococcaceae bacterium]|nr:cobalamin-dependent protein [Myxococcaceae bacterium]